MKLLKLDVWILWSVILGFAIASVVDSVVFSKLFKEKNFDKICSFNSAIKHSYTKEKHYDSILAANIFNVDTGVTTKKVKRKVKLSLSNIPNKLTGYKLVGIVMGDSPMALFKKSNKPVVIVTKTEPLEGIWYLNKVWSDRVVLSNRNTNEELEFHLNLIKKDNLNSILGQEKLVKVSLRRSYVNKILENPSMLLTQINISPYTKDGGIVGYRVNWIARNSLFSKMGLKVGDVIVRVNGESVSNLDKLMAMYQSIDKMSTVTVDIIRRGERKTILVEVE